MRKRVWITVLMVVLLLVVSVAAVQAQANGSIRGTLYNDTNADGVCGTGDTTISGVPIEFTHSGGHTIVLTSGDDGTYGLAGVSLGTWAVAVKPPSGWVATSQTPIVVTLTEQVSSVGGLDFCLTQVGATQPVAPTPTPNVTPTPVPPTTLPESGAGAPPTLLIAVGMGILLLVGGMALIVRERRTTS